MLPELAGEIPAKPRVPITGGKKRLFWLRAARMGPDQSQHVSLLLSFCGARAHGWSCAAKMCTLPDRTF